MYLKVIEQNLKSEEEKYIFSMLDSYSKSNFYHIVYLADRFSVRILIVEKSSVNTEAFNDVSNILSRGDTCCH